MEDEPDFLDIRRRELLEKYERTFVPKIESAKVRREVMARFTREVAINAIATIIAGIALTAGGVALGWISSRPEGRAWAGGLAVVLVIVLISMLLASSKPLDTREDHELMARLRQVDDTIAARDRWRTDGSPDECQQTD